MSGMKCDMAGGAAMLGIVSAIAGNGLPYHVIGLVPATDNKISSNALVVDDVITMMDGTTVEVQNTDAEGRLVLADALTYAKKFDPELVIDMATLTGASAAITGSFGIAVLGNAQDAIDELKTVGEAVYERLVQLPLWKEYRELLKSSIADLKKHRRLYWRRKYLLAVLETLHGLSLVALGYCRSRICQGGQRLPAERCNGSSRSVGLSVCEKAHE